MAALTSYPHLTLDDQGAVRIVGSRYKLLHLATEHYHLGWSAEEILRQHPDLRPEEVYAALTYFYDHYDEIVRMILDSASRTQAARPATSVSRAELLERRSRGEAR
jgi:uncharacterized protein (DUF433 family)